MSVTVILICAAVFAVGFLIGSLFSAVRARKIETGAAANASATNELRLQIESLRREAEASRARLEQEQTRRAAAESDLAGQRANLEEQRNLLEQAEAHLKDAFQALASKALEASSQQFLDLARTKFESLQKEATGELAKRHVAIEGLVKPLGEALGKLEGHLTQAEASRQDAYGELRTSVQQLLVTNKELRQETGSLVSSLRQPQVKGRWGELTLRRAVELAGMSPHCDFVLQEFADTEDGRLRPDLIVHLPGGANVVVDAKVPLHGFLKVASAQSEAERREGMTEHARLVRAHVAQLSSKEYWKQFEPTPEFVVLFVPGESFFSAALEQDSTLLEDAIADHVVLASPTNLIALLRAVAYGWRQEHVAKNAQEISDLGKELYERIVTFLEHLSEVRSGLDKANKSFNSAVGSLETRLTSTARKLKEKGVQTSAEILEVGQTETSLRALSAAPSQDEK